MPGVVKGVLFLGRTPGRPRQRSNSRMSPQEGPAGSRIAFRSVDNGDMRDFLLDLLFPAVSLDRKPGMWLTTEEREALRAHPLRFEGPVLLKNGLPSVDRLVAAASYGTSPLLREAVRRFKYRRVSAYGDELGSMLAEASRFLPEWPPAVLCPVPLHWSRRFLRGFNQAQVLAEAVRADRGWLLCTLLDRTRATGSQAKRTRAERRIALQGAFAWTGGESHPQRVILVDDVVTTGATLEACASVLKEAGVPRVDAIALAVAFP